MIAVAALIAVAAPQDAVAAERAFSAMAQTDGQWTAFRAYAAMDGVMFVPQMANAQEWLKDREDPPAPVMWWPGQSWVSCDGNVAVNTGPWVRAGGKSVGYFTTLWSKQRDGSWKWLMDHGDALAKPRPAGDRAAVRVGSCAGSPDPTAGRIVNVSGDTAQMDYRSGASRDGTLRWAWQVNKVNGARSFTAELWNGAVYEVVLRDEVGPSAP